MKKSTASRKVEWLQTPGSQSEETLPACPCKKYHLRIDVEEDEDELEENIHDLEDW